MWQPLFRRAKGPSLSTFNLQNLKSISLSLSLSQANCHATSPKNMTHMLCIRKVRHLTSSLIQRLLVTPVKFQKDTIYFVSVRSFFPFSHLKPNCWSTELCETANLNSFRKENKSTFPTHVAHLQPCYSSCVNWKTSNNISVTNNSLKLYNLLHFRDFFFWICESIKLYTGDPPTELHDWVLVWDVNCNNQSINLIIFCGYQCLRRINLVVEMDDILAMWQEWRKWPTKMQGSNHCIWKQWCKGLNRGTSRLNMAPSCHHHTSDNVLGKVAIALHSMAPLCFKGFISCMSCNELILLMVNVCIRQVDSPTFIFLDYKFVNPNCIWILFFNSNNMNWLAFTWIQWEG